MPGRTNFPPFPEDMETHPLVVVDYQLIKAGDKEEAEKLWTAATQLGFWYLKNHGADEEVDGMFDLGLETMALSEAEKMKYAETDEGVGYKAAGACVIDEKGTLDVIEMLNIAKDDILAYPEKVYAEYPRTVNARMEKTLQPFVRKSVEVSHALLDALSVKLGLPKGALSQRHKLEENSTCNARVIKTPPQPEGWSEEKALMAAHTDYGSLTFLHNRLGGLQVLAPGTSKWQYIRPLPGHAICNVGDSLVLLSGGILRSNLHRVVPPPGEQFPLERWSLGYFMRPGDNVPLRALVEDSPMIAEAVAKTPEKNWDTGVTSKEWAVRRIMFIRAKNFKGKETWMASGGTEDYKSIERAAGKVVDEVKA
ncbi:hypothetical protein CERSUDRAFT_111710 [Gelatoporia subvermispora B]|uniref:Fe2OG dioxygenase domain-containing protein n=1 Tax=Ceriporiopsis subvermispora (strain B) TaxID=914234 RepID=M2R9P3_CERS8|nr:hypothetical protein CERSUDRAFT_111710 [Gelatoporia subvermispora B]